MLFLAGIPVASPLQAADEIRRLPPGIVGQDDRKPLDSTAWPWHSLGRISINREKGQYCSGVLIAPDAVLTAGHCLYNRTLQTWHPPDAILFVAGLNRDLYQGMSRGVSIVHAPNFQVRDQASPTLSLVAHDWAILRMQQTLPLKPLPVRKLPLPASQDLSSSPFHLLRAGYSMDRPFLLSLHDGCHLLGRLAEDHILLTDCDSTYGDSGSPLLLKEGNQFWMIGVSSAIVQRGKNPGAYAVHATAFMDQLSAFQQKIKTPKPAH